MKEILLKMISVFRVYITLLFTGLSILFILLESIITIHANDRRIIDSLLLELESVSNDSMDIITHLKLFDSYDLYSADTAKYYLDIATKKIKSINNSFLNANVESRWAKVLVNEGLLDSALLHLNKSVPYFEKHFDNTDPFSISYLYGQYYELTTVYYMKSDYNKALEYNLKCIEVLNHQAVKDEEWNDDMAKLYHLRAIILYHNEFNNESKLYLDKGLNLTKNPVIIGHITKVQAVIYQEEGKIDSAELKLLISLKACEDSGIHHICYSAHAQLGSFYRETKQFDKSKHHYEQGLDFAHIQNSIHAIMNSHQGLGNLLVEMGNYHEASLSYKNLNKLYLDYPELNLSQDFYKIWAGIEDTIGNHKLASSLFQTYIELRDSTIGDKNQSIIAEMETKYKLSEKNNEINEAKLITQKSEFQEKLLLGGSAFLGLLGLYFWNRSRLNKQIYIKENLLRVQQKKELDTKTQLLAMSSMIEGQESERRRIAQDLHDGLGGLLATIKIKFGIIQNQIEELASMNVYQQTSIMIDNACTEVRKIAHNMMPDSLSKLGLIEAVKDISEYSSDLEIKVINLGISQLSETQEIMLYRVIQEFINNSRKHSDANQIIIQFSSEDKVCIIYLEDDGNGFNINSTSPKRGLGLKSMESRINFLGGTFKIESTIGVGTTVHIKIPT